MPFDEAEYGGDGPNEEFHRNAFAKGAEAGSMTAMIQHKMASEANVCPDCFVAGFTAAMIAATITIYKEDEGTIDPDTLVADLVKIGEQMAAKKDPDQ